MKKLTAKRILVALLALGLLLMVIAAIIHANPLYLTGALLAIAAYAAACICTDTNEFGR